MAQPTDNETWIIDEGGDVITKKYEQGPDSLTALENLIYCLWEADYGMRNAGDLTFSDDYLDTHLEALRLAESLGLRKTHAAFSLALRAFEDQYFERFEAVCDEIRHSLGDNR